MAEEPRVGATTSAREHWLGYLEDLHTRIAGCFRRLEVISQRTEACKGALVPSPDEF
jgi:hypothetical protein